MNSRDMYIRNIVAKLAEWQIEINMLVARADEVTAGLKSDYSEQIVLLKEKLATIQQNIEELQQTGGDAWEDLKSGIDNAKTALGESIDSARSRFRINQNGVNIMAKGKFIVIEGIYGSGRLIVDLVDRLRTNLVKQGHEIYEIDSPDIARARLMGAQELPSSWCYGMFKPDFFFELATRARVCSVTREELNRGKTVICKNFTLASIVHARLKGHYWFREDLNSLEARARGFQFGGEVVPDLTLFIDVSPEYAAQELGDKLDKLFKPADLVLQRGYYLDELSAMPGGSFRIIDATRHEDDVFSEALSHIQGALA